MQLIYSKYDKRKINELEKVLFDGRIFIIETENQAQKAVNYLLKQPILGFDTETRPSFNKGPNLNKVALLQVSTKDTCFLFRLNKIGFPSSIRKLLEDKKKLKVGLSWSDDLRNLSLRGEFHAGTFVELQEYIKILGIKDKSLQKLYANLYGKRISKSQQLTNWEAETLSEAQQRYAATDAWACVMLYEKMTELAKSSSYVLEIIPEPPLPIPTPEQLAKREERRARREAVRRRRRELYESRSNKERNQESYTNVQESIS